MVWILLSILGLIAETMIIVVLGRRATGDDDTEPSLVVGDDSLASDQ